MENIEVLDFSGGINLKLQAWRPELAEKKQCVLMQNFRYQYQSLDLILGTRKFQSSSLGSGKVTAIMPYYNDQTDQFELLCSFEDGIYKKNFQTNEWSILKGGLTPNSIFTSTIRNGVMYIASVSDGLMKYLGGNTIYNVGGGITEPGNFRVIVYMKEIDRMFGISDDAILGQITWCDLSDPETWDAANVDRMKLQDGERTEGGEVLYGKLIIFNTYSIWIYYVSGNEENWRLEQAPTTVGCVAPNTIKKVGNEIWFLGQGVGNKFPLGIYAFNGSTCRLLTDDITPYLEGANKNNLRNACADVHGDLYTISLAMGFSTTNNISLDLDILNLKPEGTPAIYGPHTFGFISSCVLNGRQANNQFLMGDESDGFVYYENGNTLKSSNGVDGSLIPTRFLSRVHMGEPANMMFHFPEILVFFRPTGYFEAKLKYYLSFGGYAFPGVFNPSIQQDSYFGEYDIYESLIFGGPALSMHIERPGVDARGSSIQIEIGCETPGQRLSIEGYSIEPRELYKVRKVENYAI